MPYGISNSQSDCSGWATVKKTGNGYETIGCHKSKVDAIDQMVAVSLSEKMEPLGDIGKRYNPNQPRDKDGQWTSSGAGGAAAGDVAAPTGPTAWQAGSGRPPKVRQTDSQAQKGSKVASVTRGKERQFDKDGNSREVIDLTNADFDQRQALSDSLMGELDASFTRLEADGLAPKKKGRMMMTDAVSEVSASSTTHLVVARGADGTIAGALSLGETADIAGSSLEMYHAGSLGIVDGTGSVLFNGAVRVASDRGVGLLLTPLDSAAESFWEAMGFSMSSHGVMRMPAGVVRGVADNIGD